MLHFALAVTLGTTAACAASVPADYPIRAIDKHDVKVTRGFWFDRLETNRTATLRSNWDKCNETPRIANFTNAANRAAGTFGGIPFDDSDVYKVVEGSAYVLAAHPDPEFEKYVDWFIGQVAKAQEPDGYLYTARTLGYERMNWGKPNARHVGMMGPTRWSNIRAGHELYNVGHMYEAAVAWYEATGKRNLLDVAIRSADLVDRTFGPAPAHPRLLLDEKSFAALRERVLNDPLVALGAEKLRANADLILKEPPLRHELGGKRMLGVARRALMRLTHLALALRRRQGQLVDACVRHMEEDKVAATADKRARHRVAVDPLRVEMRRPFGCRPDDGTGEVDDDRLAVVVLDRQPVPVFLHIKRHTRRIQGRRVLVVDFAQAVKPRPRPRIGPEPIGDLRDVRDLVARPFRDRQHFRYARDPYGQNGSDPGQS